MKKDNTMKKYSTISQPEQIPYLFMEAWNQYDAQGIADLFYEDADFVNVTGKWWDNKMDIWKAHDFGLRVIFKDSKMQVLKVKVKNVSEGVAIVHAKIQVEGQTQKEESKAGIRHTMFIFVAKKEKDAWLVVSAQNTDITGKQTNIKDEDGNLKSISYKERRIKITRDLNEED